MCELRTSHNIVSNLNPCYDITYSLAATFFINAKSPKADTPLLQELVDYLKSGKVSDGISKEIDEAVTHARRDKKGAQMFYTLEDKIREVSNEAREEGRILATIETALKYNASSEQIVQDLVENCGLNPDAAMKSIEEYRRQNNEQ